MQSREEEMEELENLLDTGCVFAKVKGGCDSVNGKVNILLQSYVSRALVEGHSLLSDQAFVVQNVVRIVRALFEVALRNGWPSSAKHMLRLSKNLEHRLWYPQDAALKQFVGGGTGGGTGRQLTQGHTQGQMGNAIPAGVLEKVDASLLQPERLLEMDVNDLALLLRANVQSARQLKEAARWLPRVDVECSVQPVTRSVLRLTVRLTPHSDWRWNDRLHGSGPVASEPFWLWVEDPENDHIYYHETVNFTRKQVSLSSFFIKQ